MPTAFGLTLSTEEHDPGRLVEVARMAEEWGFDFVSISDHYHPWVGAQGHSPFVWTVLGALPPLHGADRGGRGGDLSDRPPPSGHSRPGQRRRGIRFGRRHG